MYLTEARKIADKWIVLLRPWCKQIAVAGSVRRSKHEVKDIEIVAEPIMEPELDLFGVVQQMRVPIMGLLDSYEQDGTITRGKRGEKYQQIGLPEGINLDLFLVTPPAQWGVIFTIRTGPADFSQWLVTQRNKGGCLPSDLRVAHGAVWRGEHIVPMPDEIDFLDLVGVGWINPSQRKGPR